MAERDVTLRLSTKVGSDAGLKKIGQDALAANKPVKELETTVQRIGRSLTTLGSNAARGLGQVGTAAANAARQLTGFATAADKAAAANARLGTSGTGAAAGAAGRKRLAGPENLLSGLAGPAGIAAALPTLAQLGSEDFLNLRKAFKNPQAPSLDVEGGALTRVVRPLFEGAVPRLASSAISTFTGGASILEEEERLAEIGKKEEARLKFVAEQRQRITDLAKKALDLQQQLVAKINEEGKLRVEQLTQQRDAIRQRQKAAEGQAQKLGSFAESFGSLNALERLAVPQVAGKLARGQALNQDEQRFAERLPFLEDPLARSRQQQGLADPRFAQALQLTGQAGLLQAPQQASALALAGQQADRQIAAQQQATSQQVAGVNAAVQQAFTVNITPDARSLAESVAAQVLPQLLQAQQQAVAEIQQQFFGALRGVQANRRAIQGGAR